MNIKKSGGCSISNDDDLRKHVHEDGDLLKQQVKYLSHACNGLLQDLAFGQRRVADRKADFRAGLRHRRMLVLDFWHPANRFP